MNILTLSDHTAQKSDEAARQRNTEYEQALKQYRATLDDRAGEVAGLKRRIGIEWHHKNYFSVFTNTLSLLIATCWPKPKAPTMRAAGRDEVVWSSGNEGEARVTQYLSQLSNEWTLVKGYFNRKGEIDQLLVGPAGIIAIEIKNLNGVVHCNGDNWWLDKHDRYGNLVEAGKRICDGGGRSPAAQLNSPANMLEDFVNSRMRNIRIARVVILAHERSGIGQIENLKVDGLAALTNLPLDWLLGMPSTKLNGDETKELLRLIQKDHEYHQQKRLRREAANSTVMA